ncbi:glutathione S-transferase family protein [uncultured Gilvimarinus sp.]|uniref:glutathione S-transferase family protein n=1 Tax=uncultured Gilvimarinus sp. TaxID=1689143 RepID=UPI0030ED23D6|tara:strand:- start:1219 stop:1875 length:657 start_codon:yes stop_codon:yes gene_type:complete
MSQTVQIYGATFSVFVRVVALVCEEKNIPYQYSKTLKHQPFEMHSEAHFNLHPFGKIPILQHGDNTLCETASIIRYLDRAFGPETLQGGNEWERAHIDQWCSLITHYIDFYVVRQFMLELVFPKGANGEPRLDVIADNRPRAEHALNIIAQQLGDTDYLVGDQFSLADAMLAPMLAYNKDAPDCINLVRAHPKLLQYANRLQARASGQRVLRPMSESM